MSQLKTLVRTGLALAVLGLVAAGSASLSYALGDSLCGCSPTTPCRCAADGVCRPKRDSWGFYNTRWRQWPGDPSAQSPTLADQGATGEPEVAPLPDYEVPPAEQEDLRAPKKKKKAKDDEDTTPMELPGAMPEQLLPGPGVAPEGDALPDLDPFSRIPEVPQMEDAPPALPASLRQAAISMGMPRLTMRPTSQPTTKLPQVMQASAEMPVQQADWQSSAPAKLVSPAAAAVAPIDAPLQQAVYYEASDQDISPNATSLGE